MKSRCLLAAAAGILLLNSCRSMRHDFGLEKWGAAAPPAPAPRDSVAPPPPVSSRPVTSAVFACR
jgi:hypothetical protein